MNIRWGILVYGGVFDPDGAKGPNFQFSDVGSFDLNEGIEPVNLSYGDNMRVTAVVGEFNDGLFQLYPLKTRIR